MDFLTLNDDEVKELYRLQRFYWKEAVRCEEARPHLAGCVMLGSALETLLILMVDCFPEEAVATGVGDEVFTLKSIGSRPSPQWGCILHSSALLPSSMVLPESEPLRLHDSFRHYNRKSCYCKPAARQSNYLPKKIVIET